MALGVPVGIDIIERIAQREGVEPDHLDAKLYEVIDPDALARLVNGTSGSRPQPDLRIEFSFHGYDITVDGTGAVTIEEHRSPGETHGAAKEGLVGE